MRNFQFIATVDPVPLLMALHSRPQLWNQHNFRRTFEGTPHGEADDILLRYAAPDMQDPSAVIEDMAPVEYPAWYELPQVRPIVFDLMRKMEAVSLGRVIISRLRPGARILEHSDDEGEYATLDTGRRFHVALQGMPGSLYHCGGETIQMLSGQVWWFQHRTLHSVENNSADDRLHLMIDIRTER